MQISSLEFKEKEKFPISFTGEGANVSPSLVIEDVPEKARTLVLVLEDPDAEKNCGHSWIHWVLFNIPAEETIKIAKNSYLGLRGINDYGKIQYSGPMPPRANGTHHYFFRVFALDCELSFEEGAKLEKIKDAMSGHVLDKADFYGVYWRD